MIRLPWKIERRHATLLAVFAVSLAASLTISTLGFLVRYGDGHSYTDYARGLLSGVLDGNLYYRTPGYPLLLIATGATAGTFAGLLLAQAVAAAMIPLASYGIIARISQPIGVTVAFASIASLVPFVYVNTVYPDQAYIVLLVLSSFFLARWLAFADASRANLYALAIVSDLLYWMRPIGLTVTITCFLLAALKRRYMISWLVCVTAIVGVHAGWHAYQATHTVNGTSQRSMLGRQLFFKAYMWSDGMNAPFSPQQGPATAALRSRLTALFADSAHKSELEKKWGAIKDWGFPMTDAAYHEMFGRFDGNPEAQVAAIFELPNAKYFYVMFIASDVEFGPAADRLFLRAAIEQFLTNPLQTARAIIGTYWALVFGPAWQINYYHMPSRFSSPIRDLEEDLPVLEVLGPKPGTICTTNREASAPTGYTRCEQSPWMVMLANWFSVTYPIVLPGSFILMVIGVVGLISQRTPARTSVLCCFAIHTVGELSLSPFVDPKFRYQFECVPLAMMAAGFGLLVLRQLGARSLRYLRTQSR